MPVNFGLIGPGGIANRSLAPAINSVDGIQLWSVTSRSLDRAEKFARDHGAVSENPGFDDYDEMLADPRLDAVVISTPDRLHFEHGVKAARAGKHVMMEKPMVASPSEARELVSTCNSNGVKLGVAYHLRWHRGHRKLIKRIHDGAIGEIHHVRVQWSFQAEDDSNWRAHEKVGRWWGLGGVGTHGLDLIRWAMLPGCGEVTDVDSTITHSYWGSPHDETAMINMKFESGATAELTTSVLFESEPEFKIYGQEGKAVCRGTLGPHGGGSIKLKGGNFKYTQVNPYRGEFKDFFRAIDEDKSPEVTGEEGLRNVEILDRAAPER